MRKIAFLFPGQGAQYVGMAKEFYDQYPVSRQVFAEAEAASGMPLREICFTENEKIHITKYTQAAMLTASMAIWAAVQQRGIRAQVHAGLSLGEYGALTASGALTLSDAVKAVVKRGLFMQEAVPTGGAMRAVLGLSAEHIEAVLKEMKGAVSIANYNCPGQLVITGEEKAVEEAALQLKEAGARRVLPLKVSGPFHSPMLTGAGKQLAEVLEPMELHPLHTPYVTNVTASYVTGTEEIKELLEKQVSSPVRWQQSMEAMIADGVNTFIEIGPGRTLTGFAKKISWDVTAWSIEKPEDLEKVLEVLKEEAEC